MHRPSVGAIAAVLLLAGAWFYWSSGGESQLGPACWRVAAVMGALWLAHPQVSRLPRWYVGCLAGGLFLVFWRAKLILAALPVLALLWFLRPRPHRR